VLNLAFELPVGLNGTLVKAKRQRFCISRTIIRFVSISDKFGSYTVVGLNGTLVEAKILLETKRIIVWLTRRAKALSFFLHILALT